MEKLKVFQVKYNKEIQKIEARSLEDLRINIANVFGLDPIKLKITKPILKDEEAFKKSNGGQIAVMGAKKVVDIQQLKQTPKPKPQISEKKSLPNQVGKQEKQQSQLFNTLQFAYSFFSDLPEIQLPVRRQRSSKQCLIGLDDRQILEEDAEGFAMFYLLLPVWQLTRWADRKQLDNKQINLWIWQFSRMYDRVLFPFPQKIQPVNFFAMSCTWANSRVLRDIGCYERCHPSEMIIELDDIIGVNNIHRYRQSPTIRNLFTFWAEYKACNIKQIDTDCDEEDDSKTLIKQSSTAITNLKFTPNNIFEHELGFISLKAYQPNIVHLNQLLNEDGIQALSGQQYSDTIDLIYDEKFQRFTELPTYLFIRVSRFEPVVQDYSPSPPKQQTKQQKRTFQVDYPKFIDVYNLCSDEYKYKNQTARLKLEELMRKYDKQIKAETKRLGNTYLTEMQVAFSAFENGLLSDWQLDDMYNLCSNEYTEDCHTGGYNLIGFITHKGGRQAEESQFGTVIELHRNQWYYCRGSVVKRITLEQALNDYRGAPEAKYRNVETADLLMYRKVFMD